MTGERVIFRATTAETGGALLSMDYFAPPHHVIAPPHVHPRQEERTEVLAGTMSGRVGGRKRTLQAGESVTVPAGTMHGFRNAAAVELHTVVEFRPALRTEIVFETFVALARVGRTNARGMPSLLHTAVLTHEYLDEVGLPLLPLGLQRALLGPLVAIGRRRGYQPSAGSVRYSGSGPAAETTRQHANVALAPRASGTRASVRTTSGGRRLRKRVVSASILCASRLA